MANLKSVFTDPASRSRLFNIVFIVGLVLLFTTGAYKPVRVWLIGLTLTQPKINSDEYAVLTEKDYQWALRDMDGKPASLEQFRGEVIFVNFWATWCPPCVAEMPDIEALHADYKDKVVFLAVSAEKNSVLKKFIEDRALQIPVYQPLQREPTPLASTSIPASFLIDREGKVVVRKIGAANWNGKKVRLLIDDLL